mgnify:CR=1 FL=1
MRRSSIDIDIQNSKVISSDRISGNWELYYPIPMDRGGYDTFEILREELDLKLRQLLQVQAFGIEALQQTLVF